MKFRKLRIAWSVACILAIEPVCWLWVGSYHAATNWPKPQIECGDFAVYSVEGRLEAINAMFVESSGVSNDSYYVPNRFQWVPYDFESESFANRLGFHFQWWSRSVWIVAIPYWFLAALAGVFAAAPWMRPLEWRYSLRTLLIATTLVAVVLGIVSFSTKRGASRAERFDDGPVISLPSPEEWDAITRRRKMFPGNTQ
jgi:hypothetical protein